MKKITIYSLLFLLMFLSIAYFGFAYISNKFNYPPKLLLNTFSKAQKQSPQLNDSLNFILMGMDQRDDWLEKNQDTDTIILINLDTNTLSTILIPLPRDLWYQDTQTRINQIYSQSLSQPNPSQFIKEAFSNITGQKIDYLITLDTNVLVSIIDAIGPVEVDLKYKLVDDQYPNPDYISDPQNNPDPYITINFPQGKNIIDSTNVTYFVRSRKGSDDTTQGTDIGRSARQQLLLEAVLKKIKQDKLYFDLRTVSNLFNIWSKNIIKDIDDQTILAIFLKTNLNIDKFDITSHSLPVGLNSYDKKSAIYHPTYFRNNAWVYLPTSPDYTSIHQFIDQQLN